MDIVTTIAIVLAGLIVTGLAVTMFRDHPPRVHTSGARGPYRPAAQRRLR